MFWKRRLREMKTREEKTREEKTIILEMNELEAIWLKQIMQNPFYGQSIEDENARDKLNRENLYNALTWPECSL